MGFWPTAAAPIPSPFTPLVSITSVLLVCYLYYTVCFFVYGSPGIHFALALVAFPSVTERRTLNTLPYRPEVPPIRDSELNNNNNNNNLYLYRITWSAYLEAAISQGPVKIKR